MYGGHIGIALAAKGVRSTILQLYQQPAIDFGVEAIVIVTGWLVYRRSLPPDRRRSTPVMLMLITLLLLQLAASVSFALFPGMRKC